MIAGITPARVCEPASLDDFADLLRAASQAGESLTFMGGGTAIDTGCSPERLDTLIRTTRCAALVEYAPLDQVITVEAGMTLEELGRITGEHAQRLALDPPLPARATIGGVIAANTFGPLRTRFGTIRDTIVGISVLRADGTLVRGGGKVVKNVAGFDIPRLFVGSFGTLGAVATATLRLHPRPERAVRLHLRGLAPASVRAFARRMRELQLEPSAVTALHRAGSYDLDVLFEGFAAAIDQEVTRAQDAALASHHACTVADDRVAASLAHDHELARTGGDVRIALSAPPAAFEAVHSMAVAPLCALLEEAHGVWYPYAGCGFIAGKGPAHAPALAAALRSARNMLEGHGGSLVVQAASSSLRAEIDVWGTPPAAFSIMQRLKDRFDPQRVLAPGRFIGGL